MTLGTGQLAEADTCSPAGPVDGSGRGDRDARQPAQSLERARDRAPRN